MKKNKITALLAAALLLLISLTPAVCAAAVPQKGLSSLTGAIDTDKLAELLGGILSGGQGQDGLSLGDLGSLDLSTLRERLGDLFSGGDTDLARLVSEVIASGDFDIGSITSLLSGTGVPPELLNAIIARITGKPVEEPTTLPEVTTAPQTETSTLPSATLPPATLPTQPATQAPVRTEVVTSVVYVYQGAQTYVVPSTTQPPEEMYTYQYQEPSTVTVPELTTQTFTPVVIDEITTAPEKNGGFSVKTVIGVALLVLSLAAVVVVAVILKRSKV